MRRAIIAALIPWEIGLGLWAGSAHWDWIASAMLAAAVVSIMHIGDRYAQTENRKH
jgi:hypothetical protein